MVDIQYPMRERTVQVDEGQCPRWLRERDQVRMYMYRDRKV